MGKKNHKPMADLISHYNTKNFKPENYQELRRLFGPAATIDMNRLVCQHQQNVASAYMRRIRRDKITQRDVYFNKLQSIPLKIRRIAVGPDYTDPYTSFKNRLPKLGYDDKIGKITSPNIIDVDGKPFVSHNSLAPHNVLFKMNPGPGVNKGGKPTNAVTANVTTNVEDGLPFQWPIRPTRSKMQSELPHIKKRLTVDLEAMKANSSDDDSVDNSPRCPSNTPRNAFWSFNIPNEINKSGKKTHVPSIPKGREALAAISSVQKHNKPLPAISVKV